MRWGKCPPRRRLSLRAALAGHPCSETFPIEALPRGAAGVGILLPSESEEQRASVLEISMELALGFPRLEPVK